MVPPRKKQQLSSSRSDRKKIRDRKKNLIKKAEELSILCGVDVCLILDQCQSNVMETWPQDPEEVKRIITAYKASPAAIRDARISSSGRKATKKANPAANRDAGIPSSEPRATAYQENPAAIRDASIPSSEPKGLGETEAGESHGGCQNVVNSDKKREMLYPTWDDRLDYCSEEELISLLAHLDAMLQKRSDNEQQRFCDPK